MATFDLAGGGVRAVTPGTTRLFVQVLTYPSAYSIGRATPLNLFDFGLLRPGVQGAYGRVVPIDAADMFMDLPAETDTLGYHLFGSASVRVTEQAGLSANPLRIERYKGQFVPANTNVVLWQYVVPPGRAFMCQLAQSFIQRVAGTASSVLCQTGSAWLSVVYGSASTNDDSTVMGGMTYMVDLFAGDSVTSTAFNFDANQWFGQATLEGIEYDLAAFPISREVEGPGANRFYPPHP